MQNTPLPLKGLYINTSPLYITQEPVTHRLATSCQRYHDWIVPSFSHQRGHYFKLAYKFKPGQMDLSHPSRQHHLGDWLRSHYVMEIRHLSQLHSGLNWRRKVRGRAGKCRGVCNKRPSKPDGTPLEHCWGSRVEAWKGKKCWSRFWLPSGWWGYDRVCQHV